MKLVAIELPLSGITLTELGQTLELGCYRLEISTAGKIFQILPHELVETGAEPFRFLSSPMNYLVIH